MSIIIECDKKILQAFPMMSTPAMQFMYTNCVRQALQALNHPVRCKEIRKWIYENSDITYDITIAMVSSCCQRLVEMGLAKREEVEEGTREIPTDWCSNSSNPNHCVRCSCKCKFNADRTKIIIKKKNSYYSLV